jgi:dihydroorotase
VRTLIRDVRIVDEATDMIGSVLIEDGRIAAVIPAPLGTELQALTAAGTGPGTELGPGDRVMDGGYANSSSSVPRLTLMPAFVELHAHLRDPGFPEKETLESGSLAAVAGGYGTLVCMANTKPVMDDPAAAAALKKRADRHGLIDLFPALSLTVGMEGHEVSHLSRLAEAHGAIRLLSEDGKDVAEASTFEKALRAAANLGLPVSCHCDAGGPEAVAAKAAGVPRSIWSRIEENVATERALSLGKATGCHIHIAHVSTKEAVSAIRIAKTAIPRDRAGKNMRITAEATPHHIALTEEDAERLGAESIGRVNPSLRAEDDRRAVIDGLLDGTIDAIATDHAPHTEADKAGGAPGFIGLETAFAVCMKELVATERIELKGLSKLMSSVPSSILGLHDRGVIAVGMKADLVLVDTETEWTVNAGDSRSRGRNTPFEGCRLRGRIVMTIHDGRIVFDRSDSK